MSLALHRLLLSFPFAVAGAAAAAAAAVAAVVAALVLRVLLLNRLSASEALESKATSSRGFA